jgi:hypothetical protein
MNRRQFKQAMDTNHPDSCECPYGVNSVTGPVWCSSCLLYYAVKEIIRIKREKVA